MSTRIRLGRTGLWVSPICFGTWQLSPRFWGKVPEGDIIAAVRRAYELDVNFFDTAGAYGDGLSETVLGNAIKPLPRDRIVIATKVYHHIKPDGSRFGDLSRDYIIAECEDCLRRLQTDYLDLFQCHSFDPLTHPAEIIDGLETLVRQGKIRAYGTSSWSAEQIRMAQAFGGNFASEQPRYSLIARDIEKDVLPCCLAHNIGVLVFSPLHNGLLTGKYKGDETFTDLRAKRPDFQGERFRQLCEKVASLRDLADKYDLTIVQLVLATTLMHPAIPCAIVGIKNAAQIEEAAGAMGRTISRDDWHQVRARLS